MRHRIISIIVCFIFLYSCNSEKNKYGTNHQRIIIEKIHGQEISLEEVISKVTILPLRTLDDNIVGNIKDICFMDSYLYILDDQTASIFIFNMEDGSFVKKITRRGNGPNEYVFPTAMKSDSRHVYVLDMPTNKLICFDKELNPVKTIKIPFSASDFTCAKGNFIFYSTDNFPGAYKFRIVDKNGKILNNHIEFSDLDIPGRYNWGPGKHFSQINDDAEEIFVSELFSNKIYSIKDGNLELQFELDFQGANIPDNVNVNDLNIFEQTEYAFKTDFFIFKNKLVTSFLKDTARYFNFFDISTKAQTTGIVKDLKNNLPFFPQWQYRDVLIGFCHYDDIKDNIHKFINDNPNTFFLENIDDEDLVLLFFSVV
jgi:hypothetical protein